MKKKSKLLQFQGKMLRRSIGEEEFIKVGKHL